MQQCNKLYCESVEVLKKQKLDCGIISKIGGETLSKCQTTKLDNGHAALHCGKNEHLQFEMVHLRSECPVPLLLLGSLFTSFVQVQEN